MNTRICAALAVLSISACVAAPSPATVPATSATVTAPPVSSTAQIAPGWWNVEQVRCADLLEASDADRAAAAMFYYGYLAARAGIHVIDVSRIDSNIADVMRQCAAAPSLTVPQAFRAALRPAPARG